MSSLHGGSVTQTALGSHPQHSLQSCIKKKRIPSNLYQSHVSNSFCCETNSKRVDSYFNMTTSAVLLHLKKSMSTLREVQGLFFFLNTIEDGFIAISNPPTAPVSEAAADSQRFQPQKQALFASLHSSVY